MAAFIYIANTLLAMSTFASDMGGMTLLARLVPAHIQARTEALRVNAGIGIMMVASATMPLMSDRMVRAMIPLLLLCTGMYAWLVAKRRMYISNANL